MPPGRPGGTEFCKPATRLSVSTYKICSVACFDCAEEAIFLGDGGFLTALWNRNVRTVNLR